MKKIISLFFMLIFFFWVTGLPPSITTTVKKAGVAANTDVKQAGTYCPEVQNCQPGIVVNNSAAILSEKKTTSEKNQKATANKSENFLEVKTAGEDIVALNNANSNQNKNGNNSMMAATDNFNQLE